MRTPEEFFEEAVCVRWPGDIPAEERGAVVGFILQLGSLLRRAPTEAKPSKQLPISPKAAVVRGGIGKRLRELIVAGVTSVPELQSRGGATKQQCYAALSGYRRSGGAAEISKKQNADVRDRIRELLLTGGFTHRQIRERIEVPAGMNLSDTLRAMLCSFTEAASGKPSDRVWTLKGDGVALPEQPTTTQAQRILEALKSDGGRQSAFALARKLGLDMHVVAQALRRYGALSSNAKDSDGYTIYELHDLAPMTAESEIPAFDMLEEPAGEALS